MQGICCSFFSFHYKPSTKLRQLRYPLSLPLVALLIIQCKIIYYVNQSKICSRIVPTGSQCCPTLIQTIVNHFEYILYSAKNKLENLPCTLQTYVTSGSKRRVQIRSAGSVEQPKNNSSA